MRTKTKQLMTYPPAGDFRPARRRRNSAGVALLVVIIFIVLGTMVTAMISFATGTRLRQARLQGYAEQAFYLAEGGAERAASMVAKGQVWTTTLTGDLGAGSYDTLLKVTPVGGGESQIDIVSTGTVNGVSRGITMRGVRRISWARYALWYDQEIVKLWISVNEKFNGPVYSKPQLHFHAPTSGQTGQARFYDLVRSAASSIETQKGAEPIFDRGKRLNADIEDISVINFNELKRDASLELEGHTTIELSGKKMYITNERKKDGYYSWNRKEMAIPEDGMIYIKTSRSGTTTTRAGKIFVAGKNGLDGRLTLVAEDDIEISDHLIYKRNPQRYPDSEDALGLIAKNHVRVGTGAPNNLNIYAHIICQTGGFGVINYNYGKGRGFLNVYGGIVNKVRNAVGLVGSSGYDKNYMFDPRFARKPPPHYPTVADELEWIQWEG